MHNRHEASWHSLYSDVRLGYENKEILTPNVKVVFLQIFSVTQRELDWL
ncbi:hypothetical protein [Campylobacter suis]|nr:hypothetical protein [Campylobacter suis]